jgi:hypothetical protein
VLRTAGEARLAQPCGWGVERERPGVTREDEVDSGHDSIEVELGQTADTLGQQLPVDRHELRDVCDRVLRQARGAGWERTFPGAAARRWLLVSGTTTVVEIRLALKASPWTITTGRRNPAPELTGFSSDAQQTSPWPITIRYVRASDARPLPRSRLGSRASSSASAFKRRGYGLWIATRDVIGQRLAVQLAAALPAEDMTAERAIATIASMAERTRPTRAGSAVPRVGRPRRHQDIPCDPLEGRRRDRSARPRRGVRIFYKLAAGLDGNIWFSFSSEVRQPMPESVG